MSLHVPAGACILVASVSPIHVFPIQRVLTLVEMRPKSLHVTGMFLACNMQGFGTFAMHVCMLCACNMHTTCRDFECFQCLLHVTCIQHAWKLHATCTLHARNFH